MCYFVMCHDISNAPLEHVMVTFTDVMAGYCDVYPSRLRTSAAIQEDLYNKALEKVPDLPTVRTGAKNYEVFYTDFAPGLHKMSNLPAQTFFSLLTFLQKRVIFDNF